MTELLRTFVMGQPRPQGSISLFRAKSGHEVAKYSDTTIQWRHLVTTAVRAATEGQTPTLEAVVLHCVFHLPRPAGHFMPINTKRTTLELSRRAPRWPTTFPDVDKLLRAIGDAITDAGTVWKDDAQVVEIRARKIYAPLEVGAQVVVFTPKEHT